MKSSGSAISSARWMAASDRRVPSLVSSGMPVTVALTGAAVRSPTSRCAAALRRAICSRVPETDSSSIARSPAGRRALRPDDADHGLRTRTPGRLASRRTSALPCALTSARGPCSRTGTVAASPKLPPIRTRARSDSELETCSVLDASRPSMPRPTTPSTATTLSHADSTAQGCRVATRVSTGAVRPRPSESGCIQTLPERSTVAVLRHLVPSSSAQPRGALSLPAASRRARRRVTGQIGTCPRLRS